MIDYIIVGGGLAGIAFAETAIRSGKSVCVFDNGSTNSSSVAAGLYNPVILKRFSGLQNAQRDLDIMNDFYDAVEDKLNAKVRFAVPLLRRFASVEEQNAWFEACDNLLMSPFLSTDLNESEFNGISSPHKFGVVNQTGFVLTTKLLKHYRQYLRSINSYSEEDFVFDKLSFDDDHCYYDKIVAGNIVFAEGFAINANPYFNFLPLNGTKGEILTIHAPDLEIDVLINAGIFILPLGDGNYKIGATYNWEDKSEMPTPEGRSELVAKIGSLLTCKFEVIDHQAGVRPTTRDRKPLIGTHPSERKIHVLNGLGTRGVMLAPAMAKALFDKIESQVELPREIDIARFTAS